MTHPHRQQLDPGIVDPEPWPCECQSDGLPNAARRYALLGLAWVLILVGLAVAVARYVR